MTDVVVMVGTRFAALEAHGTRWRALLTRWVADPRVSSLTVVDYPRFGRSLGSRRTDSWLPGCHVVDLRVPAPVSGALWDRAAWAAAGRAVSRSIGRSDDRLLVAATPLSAPLLRVLPAQRRAFDAVDDWRELPSMQAASRRVDAGYREAAGSADVTSSVSEVLTTRLRADYGIAAHTVVNGVDAPAGTPVRDGLPSAPFAIYVGTVQERVDLALLEEAARVAPVVVAGSATDEAAAVLRRLPLTWLGPVPVGEVGPLLLSAAVGLVPHHRDLLTESMAPMKVLEYAAAGLPVVSTSVPGLANVPRVTVADDPVGFAAAVVAGLQQPRVPPSQDWLTAHSWDGVSDTLLRLYGCEER